MNAQPILTVPSRLKSLVLLARLLERLEASGTAVDPDQYRLVVQRLTAELAQVQPDEVFNALLDNFPATAEVYENLQYEHAGLVRSPLDRSMSGERSAAIAIHRARMGAAR
jgi:hypothetical protein